MKDTRDIEPSQDEPSEPGSARVYRLRSGQLAWREIEEETVVLDLEGSTYLAANRSGTLLWRLLEQGSTRKALAAALVDAFGLDLAVAFRDTDAFLEELGARCLLEP